MTPPGRFLLRRLRAEHLIDFSPRESEEELAETIRELESVRRGRGLGASRVVEIPRDLALRMPKRRGRSA